LSGVDAAAFAVSAEGGEHVALVVEARAGTPAEALADVTDAIRAAVAEAHDVQLRSIVFIRRGTLPKTSSGKIQRSMCRAAFADGSFAFELARFELEAEPERSCLEEPDGRHPDPASAERADAAIAGLRALAEERLNLSLMDERRTPPPHVVLELGNLGILGLQAPVEDGGLALSTPDAMRVLEQIGAIDISVGVMTILQNGLGLRPLMRFGRPGQLDAHLPKLASGRALVAFAYTEPAAGSNVRGIEATARPEGDGIWRLDGTKSWSGSSAWASVINVFAREVDAAGAPRGISAFVARPGVDGLRIGDESLTMGMKATIQSCVEMDGLLLRDEDRLGAPGQGMEIAQDAMMFTRLCLAGLCLGAAKKALRIATRFAAGRHVVTGPLIDHPLTLSRLSGHLAAVRSLEVLVASTATLEDLPDRAPPELLTACKILAPELLWAAADDALQLLAGRGYMEHNLLAMLHRDARAIRIFEGPTEALRHHLGAQLFENVDRLCALVVTLGGDEGLATRLRGFAARQAERPVPAVAVAMGMERPWLAQAAGEVTARALLAALVTKATAQADSAERRALDGAMAWCIARLEEAERAAFTLSPDAVSARDADELVAAVRGFEAAIGNGAYRPAGVERTPDPAITGDDAAPNHHSPSQQGRVAREGMPTSASLAAQSQDHDRDHDLRAWLDCWIADNLKVPRARITPDRPFAALGLDSVTAVNLAMDLEALLGRPVDATLVWDYPTTAKLASHLAGVPAKPASPPLSASEELDGLLKELGER
ncbi:MAG: acyl-CoA dehydrogenase family protein, partial [Pseudomonadota bacterium]